MGRIWTSILMFFLLNYQSHNPCCPNNLLGFNARTHATISICDNTLTRIVRPVLVHIISKYLIFFLAVSFSRLVILYPRRYILSEVCPTNFAGFVQNIYNDGIFPYSLRSYLDLMVNLLELNSWLDYSGSFLKTYTNVLFRLRLFY